MLGLTVLLSGCAQTAYLAQSVNGHLQLMGAARPVSDWLADDSTPPNLRERLQLSQAMRDFAIRELALPDNRSYRSYADLKRPAAVWNVVAAPELSLQLQTWCFPMMGCVGYRGYFAKADAEAFAAQLKAESPGLEVSVYGVPAYSTLGWTNWMGGDPLLNTFIGYGEGELARMIFHELAHQVAYAADDTMFNESFATAVEQLGAERWLAQASPKARADYAASLQRREGFRRLTLSYRERLAQLYASPQTEAVKRAAKAEVMAAMRAEYAQLKASEWAGFAGYDGWFAQANNASLGVQAAYTELTPQFLALYEREGRDFQRFYAAVQGLARLPREQRRATLAQTVLSPETR